ncbi:hypothetical protein A2926_00430 [Candidatus Giovannonibacteria bacterium RIFCSPLOWO2_01_FULL_44_40]|uniref:Uncharacterized protein n=1 Tax=Candidatus Giovannonibacteria bacterium RIFCSPHIGHO2_01_FULL_45_23 TaxID=1798325 RepID=A0A1F5VEU7_9BACT|nr:MAG: hypothetical protein A2834_00445 [Candidatus Giovannonibacteria bacterium RIFCSPHIGHO2_01_FULL_45_23]OGF76515.1 MAG: hypothetical protein A3C77_03150 [Candidatus Giovannonibacteria bacterium RIFCSPHIGHO2_02_FULL_45_13]OGF79781.1 MAG: hypothetical protein A2926_00430 [Candidatus Giovannonibacteria bacterium RIFCSPLOWO2_01_FULL_44_40]
MLKEFPRGLEDSSGRIAEFFLFGKVRTGDPHYQKEARDCLAITDPQAREICAIRLIRKRQPSDPKNPKKLVMKDLLFETAAFLDLKSKEELERLEVLTTIDSIADFVCHADLITLLKERNSDSFRIAKLDYSKHPKTLEDPESSKADLLVGDIPDPAENPRAYKERIIEIAQHNAKILKTKMPVGL